MTNTELQNAGSLRSGFSDLGDHDPNARKRGCPTAGGYTVRQHGQFAFITAYLSRAACALAHGLSACGPCAHLLDGLRARARRGRDAGDAHGRPALAGDSLAGRPGPGRALRALRTEPAQEHLSCRLAEAAARWLSLSLP